MASAANATGLGGIGSPAAPLRMPAAASFTALLLAYVYLSRFVHDMFLVPFALGFLLLGAARLNRGGVALLLGACGLVGLQVLILGGRVEHPGQILHVFSVLFLCVAVDDASFDADLLPRFCRATTALNVALMVLAYVPVLAPFVYWGEDRGVARYMSILPEPSFVGLYSVLNFFVLMRLGDRRWAYANLLPLAASFSFAGAIAFALLGAVFARSLWKQAMVALLVLAGTLGAFFLVAPEMFSALVVSRVVGAATGGDDESLVLRVFAPLDLIEYTFSGPPLQTLLGLGMGNVEHYIYFEQAALELHWRADGARSAQPDSILAFVLSAFGTVGIALTLAFAAWLAVSRPNHRAYAPLRPFVVVMVLFTGLFISVHFWVWIYLLRQERLSVENPATGTETAVPA